jgi:SAM-dependent methyltransferase
MAESSVASMVNRSLRHAVSRFRLAPAALAVYEGVARVNPVVALSNLKFRSGGAPDGLPIPPAHMRFLVAGSTDIQWFLNGGGLGAQAVQEVLAQRKVRLGTSQAILDFGCGCGRVTRYWRGATEARVCGTDYNASLIDWSRLNLPFAEFQVNELAPPLRYADNAFDLVYALSVFTHLTEHLQMAWIGELTRVLRPHGLLVFSTHGERYLHRLNESERRRFAAGQLVVRDDVSSPGSNSCSAYHPMTYVRDHLAGQLEVIDFKPEGARGNPHQDLYVLRKP